MTPRIGCNTNHLAAFEVALGRKVDEARVYARSEVAPAGGYARAALYAGQGYRIAFSLKPYGAMTTAQLATCARFLAGLGVPVNVVVQHEPENGDFPTPADFVAEYRRAVTAMRAAAPSLRFGICLMGWTFDVRSGRNPEDYWPGASYVDFVAADPYNLRRAAPSTDPLKGYAVPGAADITDARFFAFAAWAKGKGKPSAVWEYGVAREQDSNAEQAAWLTHIAPLIPPEVEAMLYFGMSPTDGPPGYCQLRVDDNPGAMAAIRSMGGADCADELAAAIDRIDALTANLATFSTEVDATIALADALTAKINAAKAALG